MCNAIRYVHEVHLVDELADRDSLPPYSDCLANTWVVDEANDTAQKRAFCAAYGMNYQVIKQAVLQEFPEIPEPARS